MNSAADHQTCSTYGSVEGTQGYAECPILTDHNRKQQEANRQANASAGLLAGAALIQSSQPRPYGP
jgi:hypothetical protein